MKSSLVLSLIKANAKGDQKAFNRLVTQIAAQEASAGHIKIANELRKIIENINQSNNMPLDHKIEKNFITSVTNTSGESVNLLHGSYPDIKLNDMVLKEETKDILIRVIEEQKHAPIFSSFGLTPRRKLLLIGPPGTGKTMTAKMLAGELAIPLFVVRLEGLLSRYMGETSAHLSKIFEMMYKTTGVYLFDEFDSIGTFRGDSRDIGEVRRILSTFLQLIENDQSRSIIVAATNYEHMLDDALFRRFDDVVQFTQPTTELVSTYFKKNLKHFITSKTNIDWKEISKQAENLSFAEIEKVCTDALKTAIMYNSTEMNEQILMDAIRRRSISNKRDWKSKEFYQKD
ncbi:AAA family ATPase [Bacillus cereus]|uniref:AAA family ATPase n=1 Tax=Bacillus cereus TaxID=1396 RepID=UPI000BFC19A8|nr:AAA family ATPase [Bacillus cereus]MCB5905326.1 AAA family ATPase [Bacillus cereus]PGX26355.1 ATPase [Bacillus cereus]